MNQDQQLRCWWKNNRLGWVLAALTLSGLVITTILGYWQRRALTKASALRSGHDESQRYKLLEDINCFLGDRIAAFIITKLRDRWSPAITAGVVVVISLLSSVILALVTGRFFPAPGYRALLADSYYFIAEGLIAVIWVTYIWICKAPFQVIQQLKEEATVDSNSTEFNEAKTILNSRLPTVLAGAITLVMAFPLAYQMSITPPIWFNANIYGIGLRLVAALPSIFAAWSALLRFAVNTRAFGRLFNTLMLHPLHPDRVCGLRPFGRYAVKTTYPLIIGGTIAGYLNQSQKSLPENS